jgi:hypothetical protein
MVPKALANSELSLPVSLPVSLRDTASDNSIPRKVRRHKGMLWDE